MTTQQQLHRSDAEAAKQRAIAAHRNGERDLGKIAKAADRGKTQTSRYLSEAGLSCHDPVPAAGETGRTGAATADDLVNLSYDERPELAPGLRSHVTPYHLEEEVLRAYPVQLPTLEARGVTMVLYSDEEFNNESADHGPFYKPGLVLIDKEPELVFEPLTELDTGDARRRVGASQIGATHWLDSCPILMVHHRDAGGMDLYPDADTPLTCYQFVLPKSLFASEWDDLDDDDDDEWDDLDDDDPSDVVIKKVIGVVLARTLEEAAEAVFGIYPDNSQRDGWNLSTCRFADTINHWEQIIRDRGLDGTHSDPQQTRWTIDEDTVSWEAYVGSDVHKAFNAEYSLKRLDPHPGSSHPIP